MSNYSGSMIISSPQRAAYYRALEITNNNPDFIIHEKVLRLEAALAPGKNSYPLDLFQNNGADRPGEIKLNRNDLFLATGMSIKLAKQVSASDNTTGNAILYTFPDPQVFVGAPGSGAKEHACLETIYNGTTTFRTSPVERLRELSNQMFRFVPERGTIKQASPQINDEPAQYGPTVEQKGFYQLVPNIVINGAENNYVDIFLAKGDTAVIDGSLNAAGSAATTRNVLIVELLGFVIVNGAQANLKWL